MTSLMQEAKKLFISEAPSIMIKVVGPQTAVQGMEKIFESLQNQILNKHLLYTVLEAVIREVIPELQNTREAMQLSTYSSSH